MAVLTTALIPLVLVTAILINSTLAAEQLMKSSEDKDKWFPRAGPMQNSEGEQCDDVHCYLSRRLKN
jgi:hypothetical protein